MTTKHLRITGIVQGVGYRASFQAKARSLGLSGWVRNRLDGSVEAMASGDPEAVQDVIEWARRGPPAARVSNVSVDEDADDSLIQDGRFEQLPTA